MIARRMYKFRIFPTKAQETKLVRRLDLCRELYNSALLERKEAYRMVGKSINYFDQSEQLPTIKEYRPEFNEVNGQILQDVLKRVDKTFKAFFNRVKRGDKAGYPRFQGKNRYDSFTHPQNGQGGWAIKNNSLKISKIGVFKINLHRQVMGKVKTCTIKRDGLDWYVIFSVAYEFEQPTHNGPVVGIDVGLENFANLSNGEQVANPRLFRKSEKHLAKVQRKAAKLQNLPKTNRSKIIAKRSVTRAFRKVKNQRLDFAHKLSHKLANTYSLIAVENLQVENLTKRAKPKLDETTQTYLPNGAAAKSGLNKSVKDAGWSFFISMLAYKVENTGSKLIKVDPRYTSQTCPDCGNIHKKELSERWHSCDCGSSMHRDIAAAKVILSRGLATLSNQSVDTPSVMVGFSHSSLSPNNRPIW
jgi:putative transposase